MELTPEPITWKIHLLRKHQRFVPMLIFSIVVSAVLVSLMFKNITPGLIAVFLLLASVKEFLFPVTFSISETGVESRSPGSHMVLRWKDVRRCMLEKHQITFTSLATPSRLDVFRGVTIRFAEAGEAGDRVQVLNACKLYLAEAIAPPVPASQAE